MIPKKGIDRVDRVLFEMCPMIGDPDFAIPWFFSSYFLCDSGKG